MGMPETHSLAAVYLQQGDEARAEALWRQRLLLGDAPDAQKNLALLKARRGEA
jgi:hypothetical protein